MTPKNQQWLKEYRLPIIITVLLHGILLVWMSADFVGESSLKTRQPKSIQATLVQRKEVAKPVPKKPIKPKVDNTTAKKKVAAKRKAERAKAEKARKARIAKKKADADAAAKAKKKKAAKEKAAKVKAAKAKAAKEKAAKIAADKAAAQKALADAQQKAEQQAREQDLLNSIAEEESAMQGAEDETLAMSYIGVIEQTVQQNWSRPPTARNGMEVLLEIQLVPNGAVVQVNVLKSSGDAAFDRSAIVAVNKSERFPEIADLPNRVFEKYYRKFNLLFKPEDLRL
ncbi:Protein TolA [BD1-7 clade bacterium]|uniref:Protein TolA n=1 Tax=BD1-7 clade bacterium TaxID=2029982 RepID=A0A5S9MQY1_9GAMM|nr:Protein TolA [BD1-7 clade bacterium]CAA0084961.1 Protein TolA [BD1-7 clade bacterium]